MKYSVLGGLVLSAVALLSGCLGPSLPEAKDVADGLREGWAPCTMLRPVGIKKTNGIDRGDFYQMEVEYRLEFVKDVAKEGSMPFCVELDNLKDTDAPIHQPAAMLVAAD